jgi:hypothetical protein
MGIRFVHVSCALLPVAALACSAAPHAPSTTASLAQSDLVRTADGLFPASCVADVGNGATVDGAGHVTYADGTRATLPACTHRAAVADPGAPNYTPPDSWVMDSIWQSPVPSVRMTSTFIVPQEPSVSEGQTVFLFPGMRPGDGSSVLQPVLQWGNGTPAWEAASWSCAAISGGPCPHSEYISVSPGDEIYGEIAGTNCTADGHCSWAITTTDKTTGKTTTLNSADDKSYVLLFGGVLESYDIQQCSDYPTNGSASFSDVKFYDGQGNLLTPSFFDQYDVTTYCKLAIKATPTTTELDFTLR